MEQKSSLRAAFFMVRAVRCITILQEVASIFLWFVAAGPFLPDPFDVS
jgi:hypothetical protein